MAKEDNSGLHDGYINKPVAMVNDHVIRMSVMENLISGISIQTQVKVLW